MADLNLNPGHAGFWRILVYESIGPLDLSTLTQLGVFFLIDSDTTVDMAFFMHGVFEESEE